MVVSRARQVAVIVAFAIAPTVVLTGCSSDPGTSTATTSPSSSSSKGPSTSGTSMPSTATTGASPEAQAFDGYLAALAAFDHALSDPPNPDDPLLVQTMVDPMLAQTSKLAGQWRGAGQASRYPPNSVHRVTLISGSVDGDQAALETCNVDDGVVYEPASGRVVNDSVSTVHDRVTLTLVDKVWKLSTREQVEKWEGVAGCALATS